jgi:flagellar FliL protein
MSEANRTETAKADGAGAKKSRKGLVLALLLVTLVAGGGAGGYWWWQGRAQASEGGQAGEAHASDETPSGMLTFEPFVVNLADKDAARYLKVNLRLVVSGVDDPAEVQEDPVRMLRLRSAILEYLSQQTADVLVTPEGKDALKKAVAERATPLLGHGKVTDVLFSEFVVQF